MTGGLPFLNVTRPSFSTEQCPSGTVPCLTNTAPNETLCYPEDQLSESCPITDIKIVDLNATSEYIDQGYILVDYNETATLVYSKTVP